MSDWTPILTARARAGHFAGNTPAEEDAYYAFFTPRPSWLRIRARWLRRTIARALRRTPERASLRP